MSHDGKKLNTMTGTFVFDRVSHYLSDFYLCPQQPFYACQCTTQNRDVILTLLHSFIKHDGSCTHTHIQMLSIRLLFSKLVAMLSNNYQIIANYLINWVNEI